MRCTFAVVTSVIVSGSALVAGGLAAQEDRPLFSQGPAERTETSEKLPSREPAGSTDVELARLRYREGTRLRDVAGRFRQNGETLTFVDGENREIGGLPNLNLERIMRMLKTVEQPESITWSVSGAITEFSGRNYLLITRAVYKAAAPPPSPENLGDAESPGSPGAAGLPDASK